MSSIIKIGLAPPAASWIGRGEERRGEERRGEERRGEERRGEERRGEERRGEERRGEEVQEARQRCRDRNSWAGVGPVEIWQEILWENLRVIRRVILWEIWGEIGRNYPAEKRKTLMSLKVLQKN
jgi:hypothetical protein